MAGSIVFELGLISLSGAVDEIYRLILQSASLELLLGNVRAWALDRTFSTT